MTLVAMVAVLRGVKISLFGFSVSAWPARLDLLVSATLTAGIATHIIEECKPLHHSKVEGLNSVKVPHNNHSYFRNQFFIQRTKIHETVINTKKRQILPINTGTNYNSNTPK